MRGKKQKVEVESEEQQEVKEVKERKKRQKKEDVDESQKESTTKTATKNGKQKKAIQVVAVVTPEGIEGTFTPEARRPLIIHLPFQSADVDLGDGLSSIAYDPNPPPQPEPYDDTEEMYFKINTDNSSSELQVGVEQEGWKMQIQKAVEVKEVVEVQEEKVKTETSTVPENKPITETKQPIPTTEKKENFTRLMTCYMTKKGETLKVPSSTELSCYWCTHAFEGSPCFLPTKEENGIFSVYGNFCSPQCSLAYLLDEHLDSHVRWDRMALLHRMYKCGARIYPSAPRNSLAKYGGPYSYEEYRKINEDGKVRVDIQLPPMVSILGTLDTKPIDFYDSSNQNIFTGGFSLDRFKSWSEQGGALRLKRSKPLKDRENTLDSCIQISIKRGV
jgi:hypothetical protein